jgi:hypothetical protein
MALKAKGDNIIAGDFSNFDGSLNSQILFRIMEVINSWYDDGEENALIRRCLAHYLFNATYLLDGNLFYLNHSQPSGNPLTTVINCMYNMFIFRYCYLLAQFENGMAQELSSYRNNVCGVFYGDDSIMSISPSIINWYNQETLSVYMKVTGHEYTDENKSTDFVPFKSLKDVNFLKRKLVSVDGIWQAPLAVETLHDMVMWSKNTIEPSEMMSQTLKQATLEASLHGKKFHGEYTDVLKQACRETGYEYVGLSFREAQNIIAMHAGQSDKTLLSFLG